SGLLGGNGCQIARDHGRDCAVVTSDRRAEQRGVISRNAQVRELVALGGRPEVWRRRAIGLATAALCGRRFGFERREHAHTEKALQFTRVGDARSPELTDERSSEADDSAEY